MDLFKRKKVRISGFVLDGKKYFDPLMSGSGGK